MKTVVITGATSGIGLAICRELLKSGYSVIGVGHSKDKCVAVKRQLDEEFPESKTAFFPADLMQQSEVKRIADELGVYIDENHNGRLDALINNAGCVRSWYSTTEDGYEQQFALNHLAPFLLTYYMFPFLQKGDGRILMTSSNSHKGIKVHWKDMMFRKGYKPLLVYKQSKLCNMLFAYALNERFGMSGIKAYGIDPGLVNTDIGLKNTGGLVKLVWSLRKKHGVDPSIPAKTYAFICSKKQAPKGLYYYSSKEREYSRQVTKENADRLFIISEKLCGISFNKYEDIEQSTDILGYWHMCNRMQTSRR
jgi:NAD(P)-dependent dehydrogenase (short-subunit alcohol dehydrogenase family)